MLLSLQQYADIVESLRGSSSHDGAERRQHNRIDVQTKVQLTQLEGGQLVRRFTAVTRDISMGGIGLMQSISLEREQQFLCCLPTEKGKHFLVVVCKAAFCRPLADGVFGVGGEFQTVADKDLMESLAKLENAERERIQKLVLG